jgi:DNA polymerase epsilon subunit 3
MPPKIIVPAVDNGPAAVQQRAHTTSMADFELPKTTLTKLAKGSVSLTVTRLIKIIVNIC